MHRRCDSRHTLTSLRNDAVHAYSLQRDKHPTCNGALGYDEVALDLLRTSRLRGLASAVQRLRQFMPVARTAAFSQIAVVTCTSSANPHRLVLVSSGQRGKVSQDGAKCPLSRDIKWRSRPKAGVQWDFLQRRLLDISSPWTTPGRRWWTLSKQG